MPRPNLFIALQKNQKLKSKIYILFIVLLAFVPVVAPAQKPAFPIADKKAQKFFKKAKTAYYIGNFEQAQKFIYKATDKSKAFVQAYILLGETETDLHQLARAEKAYRRVLNLNSVNYPRVFYLMARLQYRQGEYAKGAGSIKHFIHLAHPVGRLAKTANELLADCSFAARSVANPVIDSLHRLDDSVNTPLAEYVNFVDNKGNRLVFTRKEPLKIEYYNHIIYREHVYASAWDDGKWGMPKRLNFPWSGQLNMGGVSLSFNGKTMYFTGCYWPGGYGSCDIYSSHKTDSRWQVPVHLGKGINTEMWDSQAVISPNNRDLYFASKRHGGFGGSDLWMSVRQKNGKWGKPKNLGDSINTSGDEMAPFLNADGQTLYFSSNGRTGLGGFDLYFSRKDKHGNWTKARNLGYPINTRFNEINVFVSPNGKRAWLSSDRNPKNKYDIFSFKPYPAMQPGKIILLTGTILDKKTHHPLKAKVVLTELTNGVVVNSLESGANGKFLMAIPVGKNYAFHIYKKGYLFYSGHFNLPDDSVGKELQEKILLEPVAPGNRIRLDNIYFEFNKARLRRDAFPELNRLTQFLKQYPDIHIQIAGFTDNLGTAAYNLKLSQARARAVVDYLVAKGISTKRLSYKGFGNTHPLSDNNTEAGRAMNRRTEIIIR